MCCALLHEFRCVGYWLDRFVHENFSHAERKKQKAASEDAASMTKPAYRRRKECLLSRQTNMPAFASLVGVAVHQGADSDHGKCDTKNKKTDTHAHPPFLMESMPRTNVIPKARTRLASSFTLSNVHVSVACHSPTAPRNAEAESVWQNLPKCRL